MRVEETLDIRVGLDEDDNERSGTSSCENGQKIYEKWRVEELDWG